MCKRNTNLSPYHLINSSMRKFRYSKGHKVRVYRHLSRKLENRVGKEMELKNLRLYLANLSIIEQNEKLRRKASLLQQENFSLMAEIQKKFTVLG